MKLFVADDSSIVRERIVRMISGVRNAEVVGEAADGAEALRSIQDLKPDLVILDLKMPQVTGLDILPLIKSCSSPPLVMVLTNYATNSHRSVCKNLGADYFFDKSREFEKVIEVIESLAEARADSKP